MDAQTFLETPLMNAQQKMKEWSKDAKETLYNNTRRTLQGLLMNAGRTLEDP